MSETPKGKEKRPISLKRLGKMLAEGKLDQIPQEDIPAGVVVRGLKRRIVIETDGSQFNVTEANVAGAIELVAILQMMVARYTATPTQQRGGRHGIQSSR